MNPVIREAARREDRVAVFGGSGGCERSLLAKPEGEQAQAKRNGQQETQKQIA